ncbi:MAG: adenylate/guanylate cyclase domain-containing protein [Marmoricola sp.]
MDFFAHWAFDRLRGHWALAVVGGAMVLVAAPAGLLVLAIAGQIVGLSGVDYATFLLEGICLITIFGFVIGWVLASRPLLLIQRWLNEEQVPSAEVRAALRKGPGFAWQFAVIGYFAMVLMCYLLDLQLLHGDTGIFAGQVVGLISTMMAAGPLLSVYIRVMLRPVHELINERHPDDVWTPDAPHTLTLAAASVGATGVVFGCFLSLAVSQHFHGLTGKYIAVGVCGIVAIFLVPGLLLVPLGSAPMLKPVRQIMAGTRRVARGDFSIPVPVGTEDELGELAHSFNSMQKGLAERARLDSAFSQYVDPALTGRLLTQHDDYFVAEDLEVTIFFIDVRNFTAFAEVATPRESVFRLNTLFDLVVPILRNHHGHPNKFLGDGLLAVFGAPDPEPDHAAKAIEAALDVQHAVRRAFGATLQVGIGINTGRVVAGTLGGGGKLEFTLIGDAVNVAARVEQLTKETGDAILLTDATRIAAATKHSLVSRGPFTLKGKSSPTEVFAVQLTA